MKKRKWWILSLIIAVAAAVLLNRETWSIYLNQSAERAKNEARMRAAEAERTNLLDKKSRLTTPIGQEEQARKQGYHKKGETPLVIRP